MTDKNAVKWRCGAALIAIETEWSENRGILRAAGIHHAKGASRTGRGEAAGEGNEYQGPRTASSIRRLEQGFEVEAGVRSARTEQRKVLLID